MQTLSRTALILALCLLAMQRPQAGELVPDAAQVLLLKSGQLLAGKLSLYGDHYLVAVPHGEIQIRRDEVERICRSRREAYLHKLNAVRFGSPGQHLQLAQWCLDQSMNREADEQLREAVALDPRHPRIALVQRELRLAQTPRPADDVPATLKQPAASADQLQGLVRQMPDGSIESFSKTIQPLLVNSCSARACHGSAAENDFRLHRYPRGQRPAQGITLRNLETVVRWVDRQEPHASRLLVAASTPHGLTRRSAGLTGMTFKTLEEWVQQVANAAPANRPASAEAQLAAEDVSQAWPSSQEPFAERRQLLHNLSQSASDIPPARDNSSRRAPEPLRPADPFDPEIFNRRYHGSER